VPQDLQIVSKSMIMPIYFVISTLQHLTVGPEWKQHQLDLEFDTVYLDVAVKCWQARRGTQFKGCFTPVRRHPIGLKDSIQAAPDLAIAHLDIQAATQFAFALSVR
jgi:hypothetical protein